MGLGDDANVFRVFRNNLVGYLNHFNANNWTGIHVRLGIRRSIMRDNRPLDWKARHKKGITVLRFVLNYYTHHCVHKLLFDYNSLKTNHRGIF